jgi:hypothetical protein
MKTLLMLALLFVQAPAAQEKPGAINGQLRSVDGAPAADVPIIVEPVVFGSTPNLRARTDAEGRYRLDDVKPGRYRIIAATPRSTIYLPGTTSLTEARIVTVDPGQNLTAQDISIGSAMRGWRGSRPVMEAMVEDSDLVADGDVVSVGKVQESRPYQNFHVTVRLNEVYKGKEAKGAEVPVVIRAPVSGAAIASGQRFLLFLTHDDGSTYGSAAEYQVRAINWGFDSGANGLIRIASGLTAHAPGAHYEDMQKHLGIAVDQVVAEIRKMVSARPR